MGRFLDRFRNFGKGKQSQQQQNYRQNAPKRENLRDEDGFLSDDELFGMNDNSMSMYDEVGALPAQKPESFHHFILDNQYRDLERSIRGFKDIWDKEQNKYITVRKKDHCFTDEEVEDIIRTAQVHLATDIKLGYINKDVFGEHMNMIYQEISFLFESIAEYRYGRYGCYEKQGEMKLQNLKIFFELMSRIQANYSRSIQGQENKLTHDSVKGQESLQQPYRDFSKNKGYY